LVVSPTFLVVFYQQFCDRLSADLLTSNRRRYYRCRCLKSVPEMSRTLTQQSRRLHVPTAIRPALAPPSVFCDTASC